MMAKRANMQMKIGLDERQANGAGEVRRRKWAIERK
jgi:hypothetical protein